MRSKPYSTIGVATLLLTLVLGLFGMMMGADPHSAQATSSNKGSLIPSSAKQVPVFEYAFPSDNVGAVVSPQGRYLLASHQKDGETKLYLFDLQEPSDPICKTVEGHFYYGFAGEDFIYLSPHKGNKTEILNRSDLSKHRSFAFRVRIAATVSDYFLTANNLGGNAERRVFRLPSWKLYRFELEDALANEDKDPSLTRAINFCAPRVSGEFYQSRYGLYDQKSLELKHLTAPPTTIPTIIEPGRSYQSDPFDLRYASSQAPWGFENEELVGGSSEHRRIGRNTVVYPDRPMAIYRKRPDSRSREVNPPWICQVLELVSGRPVHHFPFDPMTKTKQNKRLGRVGLFPTPKGFAAFIEFNRTRTLSIFELPKFDSALTPEPLAFDYPEIPMLIDQNSPETITLPVKMHGDTKGLYLRLKSEHEGVKAIPSGKAIEINRDEILAFAREELLRGYQQSLTSPNVQRSDRVRNPADYLSKLRGPLDVATLTIFGAPLKGVAVPIHFDARAENDFGESAERGYAFIVELTKAEVNALFKKIEDDEKAYKEAQLKLRGKHAEFEKEEHARAQKEFDRFLEGSENADKRYKDRRKREYEDRRRRTKAIEEVSRKNKELRKDRVHEKARFERILIPHAYESLAFDREAGLVAISGKNKLSLIDIAMRCVVRSIPTLVTMRVLSINKDFLVLSEAGSRRIDIYRTSDLKLTHSRLAHDVPSRGFMVGESNYFLVCGNEYINGRGEVYSLPSWRRERKGLLNALSNNNRSSGYTEKSEWGKTWINGFSIDGAAKIKAIVSPPEPIRPTNTKQWPRRDYNHIYAWTRPWGFDSPGMANDWFQTFLTNHRLRGNAATVVEEEPILVTAENRVIRFHDCRSFKLLKSYALESTQSEYADQGRYPKQASLFQFGDDIVYVSAANFDIVPIPKNTGAKAPMRFDHSAFGINLIDSKTKGPIEIKTPLLDKFEDTTFSLIGDNPMLVFDEDSMSVKVDPKLAIEYFKTHARRYADGYGTSGFEARYDLLREALGLGKDDYPIAYVDELQASTQTFGEFVSPSASFPICFFVVFSRSEMEAMYREWFVSQVPSTPELRAEQELRTKIFRRHFSKLHSEHIQRQRGNR